MTVSPTPKMLKQIKTYKRLLETEQVFSYAYKNKDVLYYYVVFFLFSKPVGSLVLSDHSDPSREDKLKSGYAFFHFNRVNFDSVKQLIPDIERPIELLHNMKRVLQKAIWTPKLALDKYGEDIHLIQDALEKSVLDRGYLLDADVEKNGSFEKDEHDKPLRIATGEEGHRQLDGIIRRKNRYVLDHIITKDIRYL